MVNVHVTFASPQTMTNQLTIRSYLVNELCNYAIAFVFGIIESQAIC